MKVIIVNDLIHKNEIVTAANVPAAIDYLHSVRLLTKHTIVAPYRPGYGYEEFEIMDRYGEDWMEVISEWDVDNLNALFEGWYEFKEKEVYGSD